MDLEDFYTRLYQLKSKGYKFITIGYKCFKHIRLVNQIGYEFCPITAIYYDTFDEHLASADFVCAADRLGMEETLPYAIVDAADDIENPNSVEIRKKLLQFVE